MTIETINPAPAAAMPLAEQIQFTERIAQAAMLPDAYRGKPADIMLAVGLGSSMGLSPAESLYRIAVIKGKPTASAELIASNVRKAGHKLRVVTDEENQRVKATIFRVDDPDFAFEVVRDLAWAKSMGLDRNDNYKKQPLTMLQWRAITAVARLACPEALYGVIYSSDEITDRPAGPAQPSHGLAAVLGAKPATTNVSSGADEPPVTPAPEETPPPQADDELLDVTSGLAKAMYAAIGEHDQEPHQLMSEVTGRDITSSKELTAGEARQIIAYLEHLPVDAELLDGSEVAAEEANA